MATEAKTFVEWVAKLHESVGWARGMWAERFFGLTQGLLGDWIAEGMREAVRAKMPSFAAPDALEEIGIETGLPRLPVESTAQYRARLRHRWPIKRQQGTRQGLLAAVDVYAAASGLISGYTFKEEWELDPTPAYWSRWWLVFFGDDHTINLQSNLMGSDAVMGETVMGGGTTDIQDITITIRELLSQVKRATTIGKVVIASGDCVMGFSEMGDCTMGGGAVLIDVP